MLFIIDLRKTHKIIYIFIWERDLIPFSLTQTDISNMVWCIRKFFIVYMCDDGRNWQPRKLLIVLCITVKQSNISTDRSTSDMCHLDNTTFITTEPNLDIP